MNGENSLSKQKWPDDRESSKFPIQGRWLKPKTPGQNQYVQGIMNNDVVFCTGPAGSGKTAVATGIAAQCLYRGEINKIVLTRPIVSAGNRKLGALPGEKADKFMPYLVPLVEELKANYNDSLWTSMMLQNIVIAEPLELMRGRTFNNAFILLDEAQNCSKEELVMLITRIGQGSKIVVTGDVEQSDIKLDFGKDRCDLAELISKVKNIAGIYHVELTDDDIVRNGLIKEFLKAVR